MWKITYLNNRLEVATLVLPELDGGILSAIQDYLDRGNSVNNINKIEWIDE